MTASTPGARLDEEAALRLEAKEDKDGKHKDRWSQFLTHISSNLDWKNGLQARTVRRPAMNEG